MLNLIITITSWMLFIISIVFTQYALITEKNWQKRSNINYSNFDQLSKHFSVKKTKLSFAFLGIYIVLVLIQTVLIKEAYTLRIYYFIVYLGLLFAIMSSYTILTRPERNLDLSPLSILHSQVKSYFDDLTEIDLKLKDATNTLSQFEERNTKLSTELNALNNLNIKFSLDSTLTELRTIIDDYKNILSGSDSKLITKFNDLLIDYIKKKNLQSISIGQLVGGQKNHTDLIKSIVINQKTLIEEYVESVFTKQAFSNDVAARKLIEVLNQNVIGLSDTIKVNLLIHSNSNVSLRDEAIRLNFLENAENFDKYLDFIIDSKYHWMLEYQLYKNFKKMQHLRLSSHLITENLDQMAYEYLMNIDASESDFIKDVIISLSISNKTMDYFRMFSEFRNDQNSFAWSKARKNQNIYYVLNDYNTLYKDDILSKAILDIEFNSNLEASSNELDKQYERILKKEKPLQDISFKTLFLLMNKDNSNSLLDFSKVVALQNEYKVNLQVKQLIHLNIICLTLILSKTNSAIVKNNVLEIVENLVKTYALPLQVSKESIQQYGKLIRSLNNYIVDNTNYSMTVDIVNRCEKERLAMKVFEVGL